MKKIIYFSLLFFTTTLCHSATEFQPIQTFPINGGLNMGVIPQRIADNESPDMSNFVCNDQSCYVRNGTRRFNNTTISTQPVPSLYKGYSSIGNQIFVCTTMDKIFVSTITDLDRLNVFYTSGNHTAVWKSTYSGLMPVNTRFKFATFNDKIIMVNGSTQPLKYDINAGSVSRVGGNPPNAKYVLTHKDYVLMARTSDYPSSIFFSNVGDAESWPANNVITLETNVGNGITGMSSAPDGIKIYFENSVWKLSFNLLSMDIDGDQYVAKLFDGYGCIAPHSLVNFGDGEFFLARDGFRILVGGASYVVSNKVQPIVDRIIESGTFDSVVCMFDKKNKWIWVSYEDDLRYPKGVNNRVLLYDIPLNQWYLLDGIYAGSMAQWDGGSDGNELFYGDSTDGYVYQMDVDGLRTDAREEIPIISFEATEIANCSGGGTANASVFLEGASSIYGSALGSCNLMRRNTAVYRSKHPIGGTDLIQFHLNPDADLTDQNIQTKWTWTNRASASDPTTFTKKQTLGKSIWNRVYFPLNTFEKLKFNLQSIDTGGLTYPANTYADDFRIAQSSESPIRAYYYTKPFDMGRIEGKRWGDAYINMEITPNTKVDVDIIRDFGNNTINRVVDRNFDDVLYISSGGYIMKLKKSDYSVIKTSDARSNKITHLYATKGYLWGASRDDGAIFKMDLASMTLMDQTNNFKGGYASLSYPLSITANDNNIFVSDANTLVKASNDLVYEKHIAMPSSNNPASGDTELTCDNNYVYAFTKDGQMSKYDTSLEKIASEYVSVFSEVSLFATKKYLVSTLVKINDYATGVSSTPVIQLRDKETLGLLKEVAQPDFVGNTIANNVTSDGNYVFYTTTGSYKIQKYTLDSLDFIDEQVSDVQIEGVASNSYFVGNVVEKIPLGTSGRFLQMRYRINNPRDHLILYDQTFTATLQELR